MNTRQAFTNLVGTVWSVLKLVLFAFLLGLIGYGGYQAFDDRGWISHTAAVEMFMDPNWLLGENRKCMGMHDSPPPHLGRITSLACPLSFEDRQSHNVTVKFWGKIERPFNNQNDPSGAMHDWRCTRTTDGFVCKAIN